MLRQPGEAWLYNTCSDIQGVLIARVSGQPLPEFLAERIFEPLGMSDTGFYVPAEKLDRLAPYHGPDLAPIGDGLWTEPPIFPSGAGGLVSTLADWHRFGRMLLADGGGLLSPQSVRLMTTDHLTQEQRQASTLFLEGAGWGFGGAVAADGRYGWVGGTGTTAHIAPSTGTIGILLTQVQMTGPTPTPFMREFWQYAFAVPTVADSAQGNRARVTRWPRPLDAPLGLGDRDIVDRGLAPAHQAVLVELPVLVAVRAPPLPVGVVPLVLEAHRDVVGRERPQVLPQHVVELALPLAHEERVHLVAAGEKLARGCASACRACTPATTRSGSRVFQASSAAWTFVRAVSAVKGGRGGRGADMAREYDAGGVAARRCKQCHRLGDTPSGIDRSPRTTWWHGRHFRRGDTSMPTVRGTRKRQGPGARGRSPPSSPSTAVTTLAASGTSQADTPGNPLAQAVARSRRFRAGRRSCLGSHCHGAAGDEARDNCGEAGGRRPSRSRMRSNRSPTRRSR